MPVCPSSAFGPRAGASHIDGEIHFLDEQPMDTKLIYTHTRTQIHQRAQIHTHIVLLYDLRHAFGTTRGNMVTYTN